MEVSCCGSQLGPGGGEYRRTRVSVQAGLDGRGGAKQAPGHAPATWVSTTALVNTQEAEILSSETHWGLGVGGREKGQLERPSQQEDAQE